MHWPRRRSQAQPEGLPADAAHAALAAWPCPWLQLRARDAVLLAAHPALPLWTGFPLALQLGLPAAELFDDDDDPAALIVALRRPTRDAPVRGWRCVLRHRLGERVPCVADGVAFTPSAGDTVLLWVLRANDEPAPAHPFDWWLEDQADRRLRAQHGLALLQSQLQGLAPAERADAAGGTAADLVAALVAPPRRLHDLVAALEALAADVQATTGVPCHVAADPPPVVLGLQARRLLWRALRDLLAHFSEEWVDAAMRIELGAGALGGLQVVLSREAAAGAVPQVVLTAGPRPAPRGLGLFGVTAALAGIGATLEIPPAGSGAVLARIELPAGGQSAA